ncbi:MULTISPECIES: winged helix-turn-helix domain-containing protein [Shewanella]|uniref:winged helix-turn-helix domain-containing protein n=1 Tax=Shewanella TaxID=22 RepID=UPI001EFE958D|nr:winged helix-turn-helix domain-containing protein [Shewanella sp. Isolate8]MCL2911878.1 winged helix-turn-helix domain-containing protein [Shewanella aquimarina]
MKITEFLIIDLDARELVDTRLSTRCALSLSELEVLKNLVEHVGEVVSKETLNAVGWPGRVVAPSSLTQCMSSLRKKLHSHTDVEIKNIPRYGYSLCITETVETGSPAVAANVGTLSCQETPDRRSTTAISIQSESELKSTKLRFYRNTVLSIVIVLIAGLHFSGGLKATVNYLSLLTEPDVASITAKPFSLARNESLLYTVQLDDQAESITTQGVIDNWFNYDSIFKNASEKQLFAFENGRYESVALCNQFNGRCTDKQPLNLVRSVGDVTPPLDIQWLADTKLRMEQVTYNNILLDKFAPADKSVVEDVYRADVYYYSDSKNIVRADVRLSMIFDSANRGKLVAAACITDDMLKEISIRYQFSGDFKLTQSEVDGKAVRTFLVDVDDSSFTSPQQISKESATIYREIRKHVLQNERMVLRQLHQDDDSGVWMLPLWGETMVWAHREQVSL